MQSWKRRSLGIEFLSPRTLMATDIVVNENFEDGNANEFSSVGSNAQFAGIVDTNSSHGKVFQIDYTKDETQATLTETFHARSVDASFDTRFLDPIPASEVDRGWLGIKLSRLLLGGDLRPTASMQNEFHIYGAGFEGLTKDQVDFQTFIDPADVSDNPRVTASLSDWLSVRYYGRINSPGKSDGVWIVWLNGEKVAEHRNVRWTDSPETRFDLFWVGGNISLGGDDPVRPIRRQIDNVRVIVDSDEPAPVPTPIESVRLETIEGARVLTIEGTENSDAVNATIRNGQASVRFNGKQSTFTGVERVQVATANGNDTIVIASDIPVTIDSGNGNDRISLNGSGLFNAMGGEGDDVILASGAQAILNGGAGRDSLYAIGGNKLLIGGLGQDLLVSLSDRGRHVIVADEVRADQQTIDLVFESLDDLSPIDNAIEEMLQVTLDGVQDRIYNLGRNPAVIFTGTEDFVFNRRRRT